jgi:hypothetical protein
MPLSVASLRRTWRRLRSGLYVPPLLHRLHRDQRGAWYPCCPAPDCAGCLGGGTNAPDEVQVTLAGIVDDGCGNGHCSSLNTDYVLGQIPGNLCDYNYTFGSGICSPATTSLKLGFLGIAGSYKILINLGGVGPVVLATWGTDWLDEPFNCKNLSGYSVPFASQYGSTNCDYTSSSASVTSL